MLKIIQNRNKFFIISIALFIVAVLSLSFWGLNLGIDFVGGSLLEVSVQGEYNLSAQEVSNIIKAQMPEIGEVRAQPTENGFMIRMKELSEEEHQQVLNILNKGLNKENSNSEEIQDSSAILAGDETIQARLSENRFESIGPVVGQELKNKTVWAIGITLIIIIAFVAFAFRQVSKPVASWKYGLGAIIALAHDIIIVVGIFSVLNHFFLGFEADILFITALLTILGYSVNDTIVVYDRTRENLIYNPQKTFEETVNKSVNETMSRSINTALTTLLTLLALYFLGGVTIRNFVLTLIFGIIFGTYSSIFIASPLLVVWQKISHK
ncbi:MAG: protein translocase subunit SecF [Patescibacteria group bacterium]